MRIKVFMIISRRSKGQLAASLSLDDARQTQRGLFAARPRLRDADGFSAQVVIGGAFVR